MTDELTFYPLARYRRLRLQLEIFAFLIVLAAIHALFIGSIYQLLAGPQFGIAAEFLVVALALAAFVPLFRERRQWRLVIDSEGVTYHGLGETITARWPNAEIEQVVGEVGLTVRVDRVKYIWYLKPGFMRRGGYGPTRWIKLEPFADPFIGSDLERTLVARGVGVDNTTLTAR